MRIKSGFIANSSTTSFCLYGVYLEEQEEDLYDKIENTCLRIQSGNPNSWPERGCYIGRDFTTIKDDETGAQFKESVKNDLKKAGLPFEECSTFEDGWYDG